MGLWGSWVAAPALSHAAVCGRQFARTNPDLQTVATVQDTNALACSPWLLAVTCV